MCARMHKEVRGAGAAWSKTNQGRRGCSGGIWSACEVGVQGSGKSCCAQPTCPQSTGRQHGRSGEERAREQGRARTSTDHSVCVCARVIIKRPRLRAGGCNVKSAAAGDGLGRGRGARARSRPGLR